MKFGLGSSAVAGYETPFSIRNRSARDLRARFANFSIDFAVGWVNGLQYRASPSIIAFSMVKKPS